MAESLRKDEIQGQIVHEYDGIEEADNRLPTWWLITFFGAIIFGGIYWAAYHILHVAPLPLAAYEEKLASGERKKVTEGELIALKSDSEAIRKGKALFDQHCVVCHKADGSGQIGPNLTDANWIHGGDALNIYKVISAGVPKKGMPPWGPALGIASTKRLSAYVMTLRGKNLPGKAPEGDIWQPSNADR